MHSKAMYQNAVNLSDLDKTKNEIPNQSDVNKSTIYPNPVLINRDINHSQGEQQLCKPNKIDNKKLRDKNSQQCDANNYPNLTIQMFFEFMRTAYQVNDSVEGLSNVLAKNSEIEWSQLAKIDLNLRSVNSKNVGTDEIDNNICEDIKPSTLLNQNSSRPSSSHSLESLEFNQPDKNNEILRRNSVETTNMNRNAKMNTSKLTELLAKEDINKERPLAKLMKKSLSDILHEGLLDSVLPYMLPMKASVSQPIIKKSATIDPRRTYLLNSNLEKSMGTAANNKDKEKDRSKIHRKSLETEVEIHVCDEAKNIKKDFRCPQKLLIQKMCYFADVTAGQKLEEMDISVHCDIVIFDWLMRWVKKDIIKKCDWPILEASNVIPITVSASFLQMEPLLDQCLIFCHENMSEVLKTSTILTCLNDNIFTRLANLFTNIDVETLKDKKDKVQSRLFCKLIMALADPIPDTRRGHYSSLSTIVKCCKCGKNVIQSVSDYVGCVPSAMKIDNKGNIYNKHIRDQMWTLNDYILNLRSELRNWRKVYWRLWGESHFLYCRQCNTYFPINQMDWCSYHPEIPQFFANDQHKSISFPLGRYSCCSQRAYRFQALPNHEGCRFREHIPSVSTDNDGHVLNIFTLYRDVISLDPPQLFFPEKITRLVARDTASLQTGKLLCKEPMWWDGIELAPPRAKLGLLAKIWGVSGARKNSSQATDGSKSVKKLRPQSSQAAEMSSPTTSSSDSNEEDGVTACGDSSSIDDDSDNSEESHGCHMYKPTCKIKRRYSSSKRNDGVRSWNMNLLVKYNQDNQRDFEERAFSQMITFLTKRTTTEPSISTKIYKHSHGKNSQFSGGTYVKLEAEFKEQSACNTCKGKNVIHTKGPSRARSSKPQ